MAGFLGVFAGAHLSTRRQPTPAPGQTAPVVTVTPPADVDAVPDPAEPPLEDERELVAGRDAGAPQSIAPLPPEPLSVDPLPLDLLSPDPLPLEQTEEGSDIPVPYEEDPDADWEDDDYYDESEEVPDDAGAEPLPVAIPCGNVTCAEGKVCCNESCGICTNPGEGCHQRTCGMSYSPFNVSCGPNTCAIGQECCNPSCGICAAPGAPCDQRICDNPIVSPHSESCGMNTCNIDQVCCNPSCGICTSPGEPCSRELCD